MKSGRSLFAKRVPTKDGFSPSKVFFLAGPIRGADDWHQPLAEMIWSKSPEALVVIPRQYEPEHSFFDNNIGGERDESEYPNQTSWEREWLEKASISKEGGVIFWLPTESKINLRKKEAGPYGQDTYGELGSWREKRYNNRTLRLFLGAEDGYYGLSVMKTNFKEDWGFDPFSHEGEPTNTLERLVRKIFL